MYESTLCSPEQEKVRTRSTAVMSSGGNRITYRPAGELGCPESGLVVFILALGGFEAGKNGGQDMWRNKEAYNEDRE